MSETDFQQIFLPWAWAIGLAAALLAFAIWLLARHGRRQRRREG